MGDILPPYRNVVHGYEPHTHTLPTDIPYSYTLRVTFVLGCTGVHFMVRTGFREYELKSCVLLPAAGSRTQFFLHIFTEPGAHHKVHPCT